MLASLFEEDRETHIYGLADLEEPFWSASIWYMSGQAAVGRVTTGADWVAGYAMSQDNRAETLALLGRVERILPPGALVTGPLGLHEYLAPVRHATSLGVHSRMVLDELQDEPDRGEVTLLGMDEADELIELHRSAPGESFFLPSMLAYGRFVGIYRDGRLVASAGTHATSETYGVAAVGAVITHPLYRGLGLGGLVVASLCSQLSGKYETIGLNVSEHNLAAIQLYDRLGFRKVFDYEEAELL